MTERERFRRLFQGEPIDRLPVYFFGTWPETRRRWAREGLDIDPVPEYGPQLEGMDTDWETGLWDCHGLVNVHPCYGGSRIVEETEDSIVTAFDAGLTVQHGKRGSSIDHVVEYALKPTRESWERFKAVCLNTDDPARYAAGWREKARQLAGRTRVAALLGGSLYGWLRDWMGVEEISCLMYEDRALLREMVEYVVEHVIRLLGPVAKLADFDFVYIWEDCCGANGPLFSPAMYRDVFMEPCKRLIRFYKEICGIPLVLVDSDGVADALVPGWLESGVDILFPIEVGKWQGSPQKLREQFGYDFGMMGGVDKHLLTAEEGVLRAHLESLVPAVKAGRYLPVPDHRIPPEVSLEDFRRYIRLFGEVFNRS